MGTKIQTKRGRITRYGLACGYVERSDADEYRVSLWSEHGVLHVRAHDFKTGVRQLWHSTTDLREARRVFDTAKAAGREV